MATNKENKEIEFEKDENGDISFSEMIQKAKENKVKLLTVFKNNVRVKKYLKIYDKMIIKSILLKNYLEAQTTIEMLSDMKISEDVSAAMAERIKELECLQEIDIIFGLFSFYCEGITFNIEETDNKVEEYNILFEEGIYDYVYSQCANDFNLTMNMFNREAVVGLNKGATEVLAEIGKQLADKIDLTSLEGLKNDIKEITQLPHYEELVEISRTLK